MHSMKGHFKENEDEIRKKFSHIPPMNSRDESIPEILEKS